MGGQAGTPYYRLLGGTGSSPVSLRITARVSLDYSELESRGDTGDLPYSVAHQCFTNLYGANLALAIGRHVFCFVQSGIGWSAITSPPAGVGSFSFTFTFSAHAGLLILF